jgi:hypothetical protein
VNLVSLRRFAWYGAPMAICLYLHWVGLKTWFTGDDFSWLGLRLLVHNFHDLLWALFAPLAQGTIRTLSERAYFLVMSSVFGVNAVAFRIVAFVTQFANLALLAVITRRITKSGLAGFLAPVFWCAHGALALAMSWSSAYNELLGGFFILSAFYFLLRHIESGQRRDAVGLWVCYLLGFGALEHTVVFPALAGLYALCCAPRYFRRTWPLWIPSIAFMILHFWVIPHSNDTAYKLYVDRTIVSTLVNYWMRATDAFRPSAVPNQLLPIGAVTTVSLTVGLWGFALWRLFLGDKRGIFFLGWFLLLIAPVLPLKNHIDDYYLTLPLTGLAMLGAWGCARAIQARWPAALATALALGYLTVSHSYLRINQYWFYHRAQKMKMLLTGLEAAHKAHPDRMILLQGVSDQLFWAGFADHPFQLFGIDKIYLAPGSEQAINPHPEWGGILDFLAPTSIALQALRDHKAVVYAMMPDGIADVTSEYNRVIGSQYLALNRSTVDVGDPIFADRVGPEWYPSADRFRWMPKVATLKIAGPSSPDEVLSITGYFPAPLGNHGPVHLTAWADSFNLGTRELSRAGETFNLEFDLPAQTLGKDPITLRIALDHTSRFPPDTRELGMVFGRFQIKPRSSRR